MIQEIYPDRLDITYLPDLPPSEDSLVFDFAREGLLLGGDGRIPRAGDLHPDPRQLTFLFRIREQACYLLSGEPDGTQGTRLRKPLRELRELQTLDRAEMFAAYTANHLAAWYRDNRYCGRCAGALETGKAERSMVCPRCGRVIYPRLNPAVIVGVISRGRILLTRYANRPFRHYALIAGFVEIGESLEDTIRREVMEEVGLKVRDIRYYGSQPWGVSGDILSGFVCCADGDDTIRRETRELSFAGWFTPEEVVLQPDALSLTNDIMTAFKEGRLK